MDFQALYEAVNQPPVGVITSPKKIILVEVFGIQIPAIRLMRLLNGSLTLIATHIKNRKIKEGESFNMGILPKTKIKYIGNCFKKESYEKEIKQIQRKLA